jgi:hypothetical protein
VSAAKGAPPGSPQSRVRAVIQPKTPPDEGKPAASPPAR